MIRSRGILATAVPALAILVVVAIPTKASGHVAYELGLFKHQVHSRNINFINGVNNSTRRDSTRRAQLTWHNKMNGSLRYYSTSHDSAVVHAVDLNYYPQTSWSGFAYNWGYHRGHGHLRLNTYYSLSATQWESIACEELGHFSGLLHGLGATDCMNDSPTSAPTHIADGHRDQLRAAWNIWGH